MSDPIPDNEALALATMPCSMVPEILAKRIVQLSAHVRRLLDENSSLTVERDQAIKDREYHYRIRPGGATHTGSDDDECPTYYDGCNCTVDALLWNIDRTVKMHNAIDEVLKVNGLPEQVYQVLREACNLDTTPGPRDLGAIIRRLLGVTP